MNTQIKIVCVLGRGGSGKDTQIELITQPLILEGAPNPLRIASAAKISTGDLVRGALNPESPLHHKYHHEVAPYLSATYGGKLIPDKVILSLVQQELTELLLNEEKTTFFFTGFPRTNTQLTQFDAWADELRQDLDLETQFVSLYVPESVSRERAYMRRVQAQNEGKSPRKDDREEVIETRLAEFRRYTQAMLNRLYESGRLVNINAQRPIVDVARDVRQLLGLEPSTGLEAKFISHEQLPMTHIAWRK